MVNLLSSTVNILFVDFRDNNISDFIIKVDDDDTPNVVMINWSWSKAEDTAEWVYQSITSTATHLITHHTWQS